MSKKQPITQPSPTEYLERTASATRKLFSGIEEYLAILSSIKPATFATTAASPEEWELKKKQWERENADDIRRIHERNKEATQNFEAEEHALSVLCGAVLQVALKVLELRTTTCPSVEIAKEFDEIKNKTTLRRFYIGRQVRGLPIGIIIYAGRNQQVHFDDKELRQPSQTVFRVLAQNYGDSSMKVVSTNVDTSAKRPDPAFDLNTDKQKLYSYARNIIYILGWRDYEAYEKDMLSLIRE
jgi:hypothetical protein